MTAQDLHLAVYAMVRASRGLVTPTRVEVDRLSNLSDYELRWFLATSPCVREVVRP